MACSTCRKRRRKSIGAMKSKSLTRTLGDVAAGAAGLIAAQMLNKVDFIGANPQIGGAVKLIGGAFLAGTTKGAIQKAAIGVSMAGGYDLAKSFIPQLGVGSIGYLGTAGGSTSVHNVGSYGPIVD